MTQKVQNKAIVITVVLLMLFPFVMNLITNGTLNIFATTPKRVTKLEERVDCLEKEQLTREDIRAELNAFKLDLLEDGMIIVPAQRNGKGK